MNDAQEFFKILSMQELRKRQDLCNAQIAIAHENQDEKSLANLRAMEHDLQQAILEKF